MSRRRIEDNHKADKALEKGLELKEDFEGAEVKKEISVHSTYSGVYSLQFSHDTDLLAVGYGNGAIEVFNSSTGERVSCLRKSRHGGMPIMSLRFNPIEKDILMAAGSEGIVLACKVEDQSCTDLIKEPWTPKTHDLDKNNNQINAMDFSQEGMRFATAGVDRSIRIYDTNTAQLVRMYEAYNPKQPEVMTEILGHGQRIFALKYHPEQEEIFVTGGWDKCIKVWDARSKDGVKRTMGGTYPNICGDGLDFSRDTHPRLLTASWVSTNALQLWDYSTGKMIQNIKVHNDPDGPKKGRGKGQFLYAGQFCDNDTVVCCGSGIQSAQAIKYKTGELVANIKSSGAVAAVDACLGGRLIASATQEQIKIIHMS
jgi:WD40 repeat protein